MSMYTQLLHAALRQRTVDEPADEAEDGAVAEVQRRHSQLERGTSEVENDAVSAALALQIGYDVALLRLAGLIGIESDPNRFDQPQCERTRLEGALAALGITVSEHDELPAHASD